MANLALVMMVKDEARGISQSIRSAVRAGCDLVFILDTGSTDGTEEAAEREASSLGVRFDLERAPFVDFATSRNYALARAEKALEASGAAERAGLLMLSGDEEVDEEPGSLVKLWRMLKASGTPGASHVQVEFGGLDYDSARLTLAGSGWAYRGRTHEALCHPDGLHAAPRAFGVRIVHHAERRSPGGQRARWERDLELLKLEMTEAPHDPRPVFYMAQTFDCLERWEEALSLYRRRAEMGGWAEERGMALYRAGCILAKQGRWPEAEREFLHAFVVHERPEPMVWLCLHYYRLQHWPALYVYSRAGLDALTKPCSLFLERDSAGKLADASAVACWNLGKWEEGTFQAESALAANPSDPRLLENARHFRRRTGRE